MKKIITVCFLMCCVTAFSNVVKVGFAIKDITPNIEDVKTNIHIQGWSNNRSNKLEAKDNLYVRAVAIKDKNNTLLVIL